MSRSVYLEVTFRAGEPLAAYVYLPRAAGDRTARVEQASPGLLVDLTDDGRPLGIEIAIPGLVALADVNAVLARFGVPALSAIDLAPLLAAA